MLKYLNKILDLGVSKAPSNSEKFRTRLLNEIILVIFIVSALCAVESVINQEEGLWVVLLFIFTVIPMFALSYLNYTSILRLYSTFIIPIGLFFLIIFYGNQTGLQYTLFIFCLLPLFLYNNFNLKLVNVSFIFLLLLLSFYYTNFYTSIYSICCVNFHDKLIIVIGTFALFLYAINKTITQISNGEKKLKRNNKLLQKQNLNLQELADKNKNRIKLLSILAHDLRAPINSFTNLTKKLNYLVRKKQPERIFDILNDFEISGQKLFLNLENLLHWIVTQGDNIDVYPIHFQAKDTLDEIIINATLHADDNQRSIVNEITTELKLFTDQNMFRIIMRNLISNAIKYSPKPSEIIISSEVQEDKILIIVKDFGTGISHQTLQEIYAGKLNNKISSKSYGLGLKISVSLTKLLNGSLIFKNGDNFGTKAILTLQNKLE